MTSGAFGSPTAPPSPAESPNVAVLSLGGRQTDRAVWSLFPASPAKGSHDRTLALAYTRATGREATSEAANPGRVRRMAWAEFRKPVAEAANDVRRVSGLLDALALRCRTPSCSSLPGYWRVRLAA
jgi:hypothetical protein